MTATYTLAPGDPFIRADYSSTIYDGERQEGASSARSSDGGAEIELFHPGVGYGEFT